MPRLLLLHSPLSFQVSNNAVIGALIPPVTSTAVGIIAREQCEWLPALALVPLVPTWIWMTDIKWERVVKKLFPTTSFINGFSTSLPPVDIILLGRVTLHQYRISLKD